MPAIGEKVRVCPTPGLRVQVDGIHGRFLAAVGEDVIWSDHYHKRLLDGSISVMPSAVEPKRNK